MGKTDRNILIQLKEVLKFLSVKNDNNIDILGMPNKYSLKNTFHSTASGTDSSVQVLHHFAADNQNLSSQKKLPFIFEFLLINQVMISPRKVIKQ